MKSIYEFRNYRELLAELISASMTNQRGYLSKIAKITNCQSAYISRVFRAEANLSLEQAENLADFLQFDNEQRDYFYNLIMVERAGTNDLKQFYLDKIEKKQTHYLNISNRLKEKKALSDEKERLYYSHWSYAAIHIIVGIEEYQTVESISERLNLSKPFVSQVLQKLLAWKLLKMEKNKFSPGVATIHLSDKSLSLKGHHQNWRFQAIKSINEKMEMGLHYSSVTCISKEAKEKIKKIFLEAVENARKEIRQSENDTVLCGINLDFYDL